MRGGPSKEHSMITIRPFSRTCETVSIPLPVRSWYPIRRGPSTARLPRFPLGEQFTWPLASSGAVATKNTGWASTKAWSLSSMAS